MLKKHSVPSLLLSIAFLLSFVSAWSLSVLHNATHPPVAPHVRLSNHGEDYDNYYDETFSTESTPKPMGSSDPHCDYDLCKDQQESCWQLALTRSCSCPGTSNHFIRPDPPSLQTLSVEDKGAVVVVRWCAPPSVVTHYIIQVEGHDAVRSVGENRRMVELGDLPPGTEVCIEAVNNAGTSTRVKDSCARYEPNSSESRLAVKLVLIGLAVLLVLVILVVSLVLWWCRRHRKNPTGTGSGSEVML